MRYFIFLAYNGTRFCGWQRQPNAPSVQETLELALSTILRQPIVTTGCGRTDTGVHARAYTAHFDLIEGTVLPPTLLHGLNSLLPADIVVYEVREMHPTAHARYDATDRAYEYHIVRHKDPFQQETAWFHPRFAALDIDLLHETVALLLQYKDFFPFCKTDSDADHYTCDLREARWMTTEDGLVFHIAANRFLRGMVRLIVGGCVQVAHGQIQVQDVQIALDKQTQLPKSLSAPAAGLALTRVVYPYV